MNYATLTALALLSFTFIQSFASRCCAAPPTMPQIKTAVTGRWSSASTWEGGRVPAAGDRVLIAPGHRVVFDVPSSPPIPSVRVCGVLAFAHDRDTTLNVGLLTIQRTADEPDPSTDCDAHHVLEEATATDPMPTLEVGNTSQPIPAEHTARIRLVYFDGEDPDLCPAIICCGGRMDLHGAPMSRTWVKLGATAHAGDRRIILAEPVTGWRAGDRLILTATQRDRGSSTSSQDPLTEELIITELDGATIAFDRPLLHDHLGEGNYRGEVADLTRNVVVESADPNGVRGHTMYHRGSAGSVSYTEFRHLGKKGALGRYSLHFHRVGDTMRGSSVVGASIWDSDNRWLAVHATNYLVVRDCVGYGSIGHGYFVEDGTETDNVFDRNLAVRATAGQPLPNQSLPFDHNEGAGFWWANCRNTFTGNVAADCDRYGFKFEASPANGFDLRLPVRQPDGTYRRVDVRTLPFVRFEDNEVHGAAYGINLGQETADSPGIADVHSGVGPDLRHPLILANTRIWNTRWGIRPESPSLLIDGLDIHACVYGFYRAKFRNHSYRGLTISNVALSEAFSAGTLPQGPMFPGSGLSYFNDVGKQFSDTELTRFSSLVQTPVLAISPADAERLVRGSYNTDGLVAGHRLPRTLEDPAKTGPTDVSCGPLSSASFPAPLTAFDNLPPTTVITSVELTPDHRLIVHGIASDNGTVKSVKVNGVEAIPTSKNFSQWQAVLAASPEMSSVSAFAEDSDGNLEKTPHVIPLRAEK